MGIDVDKQEPTVVVSAVGDTVEGNFKGEGEWYPARVAKIHDDGCLDLSYKDGDREKRVVPHRVKNLAQLGAWRVFKMRHHPSAAIKVERFIGRKLFKKFSGFGMKAGTVVGVDGTKVVVEFVDDVMTETDAGEIIREEKTFEERLSAESVLALLSKAGEDHGEKEAPRGSSSGSSGGVGGGDGAGGDIESGNGGIIAKEPIVEPPLLPR